MPPLARSPRVAVVLVLLLIAAAAWRGGALWSHEPMIGLANNYDMIRVQGCIDAYPLRDAATPPWSNSWAAPLPRYGFRDDVQPGCFASSEVLFAWLAWPMMRAEASMSADGGFSLRWIGAVKLVLAWFAVAFVAWRWLARGAPFAAVMTAAIGAMVVFDPGVTIYLNAMYAEFAAVLFAWHAIGLAALALHDARPSRGLLIGVAVCVVLAGMSKVQHLAFGLVLLGGLIWLRAWSGRGALAVRDEVAAARDARISPSRGALAAVAIGALIALAAQAWHLRTADLQSMRRANLTNTVLQAVLGSSPEPARTAAHLGLPADCAAHAGKTWFSPGVQEAHPCPAVFELSRLRIAATLLCEPDTLRVFLGTGVRKTRPWLPMLGQVEGEVLGALPVSFFTLDRLIAELPPRAFAVFLFAPSVLMLAASLAWRRRVDAARAWWFATLACAAYAPFSLATVVLGDGFADVAKQFHLGMACALASWILIVGGAARAAWQARPIT